MNDPHSHQSRRCAAAAATRHSHPLRLSLLTLAFTILSALPARSEVPIPGPVIEIRPAGDVTEPFAGGSIATFADRLWGDYFYLDVFGVAQGDLHNDSFQHVEPGTPVPRTRTANLPPRAAASFDPANLRSFFAYAVDGTGANSLRIDVHGIGNSPIPPTFFSIDDIPSVGTPDDQLHRFGMSTDELGRCAVVFPVNIGTPQAPSSIIRGQVTSADGTPIFTFDAFGPGVGSHTEPDITPLDPSGDCLACTATGFPSISLSLINFKGPAPQVFKFPINTTFGAGNRHPAIAADTNTGNFTVVWENLTGNQTSGSDIRARRFDSSGNPMGSDFRVNTTIAGSQGSPDVAYCPDGKSIITWAGDALVNPGANRLDVFMQVYNPDGNKIGSESRVNEDQGGYQDLAQVESLPGDTPAFAVSWRDADAPDGTSLNGSGFNYRCFTFVDPGTLDSDGDGQPDDDEIDSGFDPNDPLDWFHISEIEFDENTGRVRIHVPITKVGFSYTLNEFEDGPNSVASPVPGQENIPGTGSSLIFEDGFESGDTSSWSVTTP